MLNILLHSPYQLLKSSLFLYSSMFDDLICIQDGVILCTFDDYFLKKVYQSFNIIYFLKYDLSARGLLAVAKKKKVITINYEGFVYLTLGHNNSITW